MIPEFGIIRHFEIKRQTMSRKPNIIIFNPDQMRADALNHLGNKATYTPNIDGLSKDGVSFSNAFCQNPVCTPSRCSFMSGWYPHVRGHRTMHHMMQQDEPVLLKELKDNGYFVWMNNRNDLLPAQNKNYHKDYCDILFKASGVDLAKMMQGRSPKASDEYYSFYRGEYKKSDELKDRDTVDVGAAVDFIGNYNNEKPMCLFLGLMDPHPPYVTDTEFYDKINRDKLPKRILPPVGFKGKSSMLKGIADEQSLMKEPEEFWDNLRCTYLAMCAKIDFHLGQVVDALKQKGIYDDTIIFFFSDHGDYTGDYNVVEKAQNTFEDCVTNVPFIIKPHKEIKAMPGVKDNLVELVDFYATAVDVANIDVKHSHFGKSLVDIINGETTKHRDAVFSEGGRLHDEHHCMDTGGVDLDCENEYYPRLKQQASAGSEHTKATMCRTKEYKYIKRLYENDEFYDLAVDSEEKYNKIDDTKYREAIFEHKELMLEWYQQTCDVVPFELDQRFSVEDILLLSGRKIPKFIIRKVEKKLEGKILNSNTLKEAFRELMPKLNK